jgi:hypothetical protein
MNNIVFSVLAVVITGLMLLEAHGRSAAAPPEPITIDGSEVPRCSDAQLSATTTAPPPGPYKKGDPICDARHQAVRVAGVQRQAPPTPTPPIAPLRHPGYHYTGP